MENKVSALFAALLVMLLYTTSNAQSNSVIRPGLVSTQLTISPSYQLNTKQAYFYFHGSMEIVVQPKLSWCGESYFYLGHLGNGNGLLDYNHSIFTGFSLHKIHNNSDCYLGVQPGIAITKLKATENAIPQSHPGINPVTSLIAGYTLYTDYYFHFFIQSRLILGEHHFDKTQGLTELHLSAGLGFNLNTIRKK